MTITRSILLACTILSTTPALAEEAADAGTDPQIVVTGTLQTSTSSTKTDTPPLEVPQPVTVVTADVFEAQGAVSISDTLNYVAGVQANPYGPDSRVDGATVRGVSAAQFRDGMRDIYSYYASIRADPYNFSQVELVRGPASVLFGSGSIGGLVNLVSKTPEFTSGGEFAIRYGSHGRKEALADITGGISNTLAGRVVARVRDSGTQTDYVPDDRVMLSPSLTWQPDMATKVTLIGLYQEDDGGSTSQFLPLVGTILPNPNGTLDNSLFVGKPGWDRYDGRLLQGTIMVDHDWSDVVSMSMKARYIDSDLTYFSHYADSYSNPTNPYLDGDQTQLTLIASGSLARMEVFSTDNNLKFRFNTGAQIEHVLLTGVDYSWNRVRKRDGYGYETIDIYDPDYAALSDWDGGLPGAPYDSTDAKQSQLGFYVQDQIRFADRVSLVLGARHDTVTTWSFGDKEINDTAMTYRAGIIGELVKGVSPFFSYTESFEPIAGSDVYENVFKPKTGRQFEAGIKFHPNSSTLLTLTAYHIRENNRPVSVSIENPDAPGTPIVGQLQIGSATSKGLEAEGSTTLPGNLQLIANVSYNEAADDETGLQLDNVPKYNASLWATKGFELGNDAFLRLGGGVRYTGENKSYGPAGTAFADGLVTPDHTLVDAMAELGWKKWSLQLNATNLLGKDYYSACLARGDCFMGAERNVYATLAYRW